jgi:hypothetical protein
MSEATIESSATPVARPQQIPFTTYDEYAAGMDGLSFGWLYARFVEYMKLNNMHPDGSSAAPRRQLAKRVDIDNSTAYQYQDNRNFTASMHLTDPLFLNMTFPLALQILGLAAAAEDLAVEDLITGNLTMGNLTMGNLTVGSLIAQLANGTSASGAMAYLPPIVELVYCGVKFKGDDTTASFIPVDNPNMMAMWMKDVRGLLIALVVMLAILLGVGCLGLCLTAIRGRR